MTHSLRLDKLGNGVDAVMHASNGAIITTGNSPQHALDAFVCDAVDFLLDHSKVVGPAYRRGDQWAVSAVIDARRTLISLYRNPRKPPE